MISGTILFYSISGIPLARKYYTSKAQRAALIQNTIQAIRSDNRHSIKIYYHIIPNVTAPIKNLYTHELKRKGKADHRA